MKQIPVIEQLLPLTDEHLSADEPQRKFSWDYIYEPDAQNRSRRAASPLRRGFDLSGSCQKIWLLNKVPVW